MPIPEGLGVGDEFLLGDGMGHRVWLKVEERGSERGLVSVGGEVNQLEELWSIAFDEAERLGR